MCGKVPSSMPVRKTTGNSRPLAVCSVISVTTPRPCLAPPSLSGISSASATSETCSRKSSRLTTSPVSARLVELAGDGDELGEVLDPGLVLRVVAGPQLGEVAGLLEHRLEQVGRRRRPRLDHGAQLLEQRGEALDRVDRAGGDARARRRRGRSAATNGIRSRSASAATQASARSPMPRLGTLRMRRRLTVSSGLDEHPQVGQRVLDLAALVEPGAADDLVGQADPDEHLLEGAGLGVGAVEDGDVAGPARPWSSPSWSISWATNAASSCSLSAT